MLNAALSPPGGPGWFPDARTAHVVRKSHTTAAVVHPTVWCTAAMLACLPGEVAVIRASNEEIHAVCVCVCVCVSLVACPLEGLKLAVLLANSM